MNAAEALARTIADSGARRVAFVGLAKNVGKTTALVETLRVVHELGIAAATTSAGRDGEAFDAITGEPKPRFRVWPGQLVASAASTFDAASFSTAEIATLPFVTRFGRIQLRRALEPGEIELIGPGTASEIERTAAALEEAGSRLLLVDGAIGRRAFAGARVADAVVLSAGLAAGRTPADVAEIAAQAASLVRLGPAPAGAAVREHAGALTDEALAEDPPADGDLLLVEDFTAVFLSPRARRDLARRGVRLAVRRPTRLLAVTSNPTAPARPPVPAETLFRALRGALPEVPVFDLVADLGP